jgi:surfactin family lipopeptide synthetase A
MNDLTTPQVNLPDDKRRLLESYLRGDVELRSSASATIRPRPAQQPAPLSLAQEQLWIREQAAGWAVPFNESVTIKTQAWLDAAILEKSLSEIIRRHEIWRTTYDTVAGQAVQIVHPTPFAFTWEVIDLRNLEQPERAAKLTKITTEAAQQRFDLRDGPLLRAMLVRVSDTDQRLFLFAHLSIIDGVSVYQILPFELTTLYEAFSAGQDSPLPELPIQYSDYAYWQREWLKSEGATRQLDYWREKLVQGFPPLDWPPDRNPASTQTYHGVTQSFVLDRSVAEALNLLSRTYGVTLFTVLVTCFSALLHCYTRQAEIVIGTPSSAGRKRSEVRHLLGYFLNPVPLRIDVRGTPSFEELLPRVQQAIAEGVSYDDLPMELLARELISDANTTDNPWFSVAISLQPQMPRIDMAWRVTSMDVENGGSVWNLYVAFLETEDGLGGRIQYKSDIFDPLRISLMLEDFQELVRAVAACPKGANFLSSRG